MQLQLRKVTVFQFSFTGKNGFITVASPPRGTWSIRHLFFRGANAHQACDALRFALLMNGSTFPNKRCRTVERRASNESAEIANPIMLTLILILRLTLFLTPAPIKRISLPKDKRGREVQRRGCAEAAEVVKRSNPNMCTFTLALTLLLTRAPIKGIFLPKDKRGREVQRRGCAEAGEVVKGAPSLSCLLTPTPPPWPPPPPRTHELYRAPRK
jgi:hypothetical protein